MQKNQCSLIHRVSSHFKRLFHPEAMFIKACLENMPRCVPVLSLVSKWAQKSFNNESARSECKLLMNHCFGSTALFIFFFHLSQINYSMCFSLFYLTFNILWLINTRDIFSVEESALLVQNKKEKGKDKWKWLWAVLVFFFFSLSLSFRLNNLEKRIKNCFSRKFCGFS